MRRTTRANNNRLRAARNVYPSRYDCKEQILIYCWTTVRLAHRMFTTVEAMDSGTKFPKEITTSINYHGQKQVVSSAPEAKVVQFHRYEIDEVFIGDYITCTKPKRKLFLKERVTQVLTRFQLNVNNAQEKPRHQQLQHSPGVLGSVESNFRQCSLLLACGDDVALEAGFALTHALSSLHLEYTTPTALFSLARDLTMHCLASIKPPPLALSDRNLAVIVLKVLELVWVRIIAAGHCGALGEYEAKDIVQFTRLVQSIKQLHDCEPYSTSVLAYSQLSFVQQAAQSLESCFAEISISSTSAMTSASEFFHLVRSVGGSSLHTTNSSIFHTAWTELLNSEQFNSALRHPRARRLGSCAATPPDVVLFMYIVAPYLANNEPALRMFMEHFYTRIVDGSLATLLAPSYCDTLSSIALGTVCILGFKHLPVV